MSELMLVGVFFPDPVQVKSLKVCMMTSTMKHYGLDDLGSIFKVTGESATILFVGFDLVSTAFAFLLCPDITKMVDWA